MGGLGFRTIIHQKKLGLGLKLHELMLTHACKARHGIEATMTLNDDP